MKHLFNLVIAIFIFVSLLFANTTVTANTDKPIESTTIDGKDLYQYDVTDTPLGKEIVEKATKRLESRYDLSIDSDDLKVYDLSTKPGERDLLIIPHEIEVVSVKRSWHPDGPVGMRVITATTANPSEVTSDGDIDIQAASYNQVAGNCFNRYYEYAGNSLQGWMDSCYKLYKYSQSISDGSSYKDLYAMFHYGTAKSSPDWILTRASLWSAQHPNSSTMQWSDWSPRSDSKRNCGTVTIGFTYGVASVNMNFTQCDTWDITKYSTPGEFRNDWKGASINSELEVAYGVQVTVPKDGWPQWYLYQDLEFVLNRP